MKTINVLSHKGGCGKSETVLNLAYGLSKAGKRVLVVDCDPQCNSTSILLSESKLKSGDSEYFLEKFHEKKDKNFMSAFEALKEYVETTRVNYDIHDVLEKNCNAEDAIYTTRYENVDIMPSGTELSLTDYQLKNRSLEPYRALRTALGTLGNRYDYVLIDNQPFKNALTFNTIASCTQAGDMIIIPTKINRGGLEGTYETIATAAEWLNTERLPFDIRILVTMTNRNKIDQGWIEALQEAFGDMVFKTTIRYQAKPVEEASMKKEILLENMKSNVAQDYQNLVNEILTM